MPGGALVLEASDHNLHREKVSNRSRSSGIDCYWTVARVVASYLYVGANPVNDVDALGLMGNSAGSSSQGSSAMVNSQKAMNCLCKVDSRFCISRRAISSSSPDFLDILFGILPAGQTNIFGQLAINSSLFDFMSLLGPGGADRLFDLFYMMAHEIQHKWQTPLDRWLTQVVNQKAHDAIDDYAYSFVMRNKSALFECFRNSDCK